MKSVYCIMHSLGQFRPRFHRPLQISLGAIVLLTQITHTRGVTFCAGVANLPGQAVKLCFKRLNLRFKLFQPLLKLSRSHAVSGCGGWSLASICAALIWGVG